MGQRVDVVNIDFEKALELKNPSYCSIKQRREFEYIYFLLNHDPSSKLKVHKEYSKKYLNYLKSKGFVLPELLTKASHSFNWWGDLDNSKKELFINSKTETLKLFPSPGCFLISEVPEIQEEILLICKTPFGVSGTGNKVIKASDFFKLKNELIEKGFETVEIFQNRVSDFGVLYNFLTKEVTIVENFIVRGSQFSGGKVNNELFVESFPSLSSEFDSVIKKVDKYCLENELEYIQFDNFIYKDGEGVKLRAVCEINHRKTMGMVVKALSDKFNSKYCSWHLVKKRPSKIEEEVLILSPEDNHFTSLFIYSDDFEVYSKLVDKYCLS